MKIFFGRQAPDDSYRVVGYKRNIDDICDDSEATEIYAPDILDYIDIKKHRDFIIHIINKLRHGGQLTIGGTDIINLSLNVFNKNLTIEQANEAVFGTVDTPNKVALTSLEAVRKIILETDLRINKQVCEPNFLIGAKRL